MPETREQRLERFRRLTTEINEAFNGRYGEALGQLTGLSKEEINSVTPDTEDLKVYSVLVKVVEKASKDNLSQAQLLSDIKDLGEIAIKIAKKIPQFATLL